MQVHVSWVDSAKTILLCSYEPSQIPQKLRQDFHTWPFDDAPPTYLIVDFSALDCYAANEWCTQLDNLLSLLHPQAFVLAVTPKHLPRCLVHHPQGCANIIVVDSINQAYVVIAEKDITSTFAHPAS